MPAAKRNKPRNDEQRTDAASTPKPRRPRRGRPPSAAPKTEYVGVRFQPEHRQLIQDIARTKGWSEGDFIRRAAIAKALEVANTLEPRRDTVAGYAENLVDRWFEPKVYLEHYSGVGSNLVPYTLKEFIENPTFVGPSVAGEVLFPDAGVEETSFREFCEVLRKTGAELSSILLAAYETHRRKRGRATLTPAQLLDPDESAAGDAQPSSPSGDDETDQKQGGTP